MLSYPVKNLSYIPSTSAAGSVTGATVPKEIYNQVYVQAVIASATSPTGTLTFQTSADGVNWSTLYVNGNAQTVSVAANGTFNFNIPALAAFYWRLTWTYSSGTGGTITAQYNAS